MDQWGGLPYIYIYIYGNPPKNQPPFIYSANNGVPCTTDLISYNFWKGLIVVGDEEITWALAFSSKNKKQPMPRIFRIRRWRV